MACQGDPDNVMISSARSTVPSRRDLLDQLPEVAHVTEAGRQQLLKMFEEVTVDEGTVILDAGDVVRHLYLVGVGAVSTTDAAGRLVLHGAGSPLVLRLLLDGGVLTDPLVAVSRTQLWTMGRREFRAACKDVPGFALGLLEAAI
jgi:hypothetical protein